MGRYILKRLLMMIPVFVGVSLIIFCICGSNTAPVLLKLGGAEMTDEQEAALKHELGYDQPLLVRYVKYLSGMLRGDLGKSHITKKDVFEEFTKKFPITIKLATASVLVSVAISLPIGIISALKRGTLVDNVGMVAALLGLATPNFWLGLLLILLFSLELGWFPSGGYMAGWKSFVLPAITVGTSQAGTLTRITRSSMLDVIRADYLRTARAKGVSEKQVIRKHALKNALIPIITVFGSTLGNALGGAVTTETIFAWPGVGRLTVNAVNSRDMALATGCIILFTVFLNVSILLVDIAYAFVDPRIKAQYSK